MTWSWSHDVFTLCFSGLLQLPCVGYSIPHDLDGLGLVIGLLFQTVLLILVQCSGMYISVCLFQNAYDVTRMYGMSRCMPWPVCAHAVPRLYKVVFRIIQCMPSTSRVQAYTIHYPWTEMPAQYLSTFSR